VTRLHELGERIEAYDPLSLQLLQNHDKELSSDQKQNLALPNFLSPALTAIAALAVGVGGIAFASRQSTAEARVTTAQAAKNRYYNKLNNFGVTVDSGSVKHCQALNVSFTKVNTLAPHAYPYGSIESQNVQAKVGKRIIKVITRLRDVNYDSESAPYNRLATEFMFDCSYLAKSKTIIQLMRKKSTGVSVAIPHGIKIIAYQENPRIFHRNQFRSRQFMTRLVLPGRLTKADLKQGKYFLKETQYSEAFVRAWDAGKVYPNDPRYVDPQNPNTFYTNKIIDASEPNGMIQQRDKDPHPKALSRTWVKHIKAPYQITFKPSKRSPWTY
jgi:hypothetical protein